MFTSANPPDLLLFEPVPQRRVRANGWSAEVQRAIIDGLARSGVVARAARSVGKSARSAYALRDRDNAQDFSRGWDQAMRCAGDAALGAARDHLMTPERVPVFYRGRLVGWRKRTNDRVLIAALRAICARPAPPPKRPCYPTAAERAAVYAAQVAEADARLGGPAVWPDPAPTPSPVAAPGPAPASRSAAGRRRGRAAAPPALPAPPKVRGV